MMVMVMVMMMIMPLMAPPTPTNLLLPLLPLWFMLFLVMAGPASAPAPAPAPPPPPIMSSTSVNITQIIESAGGFDTFVSLLTATGVDRLFQSQANKMTTGITIFAPTDRAFSTVSSSSDGSGSGMISKLPARLKITLLEFHALSAFYALSALQQAADPVTPTLATDEAGAGKFTVNVTNVDGTVYVSTGLSRSAITSTLYNSVPCGVFAVDQVLLPEEIFGHPVAPAPAPAPSSSSSSSSADISPSPREYPSKIPTVSSSPASPFGIPTNLSSSSSSSSSSSYPPPPPLDNEPTPSPCAGLVTPHLLHTTLLLLLVLNTNMMNKMWLDSF